MPIRRKSVVVLCIAVAVFAAFSPVIADLCCEAVTPQWVLLPDSSVQAICSAPFDAVEQPLALLSLSLSRAPPAPSRSE